MSETVKYGSLISVEMNEYFAFGLFSFYLYTQKEKQCILFISMML